MDKLNILWTTDNKDTFFHMIALYGTNSKRFDWWKSVNIIIWGASATLAATHTDVQQKIKEMMQAGVRFEACKVCTDNLGVSEALVNLGIDVRFLGEPLTNYIKNEKLLTI